MGDDVNQNLDLMTVKQLKEFALKLNILLHSSLTTKRDILLRIRNSNKYKSYIEKDNNDIIMELLSQYDNLERDISLYFRLHKDYPNLEDWGLVTNHKHPALVFAYCTATNKTFKELLEILHIRIEDNEKYKDRKMVIDGYKEGSLIVELLYKVFHTSSIENLYYSNWCKQEEILSKVAIDPEKVTDVIREETGYEIKSTEPEEILKELFSCLETL